MLNMKILKSPKNTNKAISTYAICILINKFALGHFWFTCTSLLPTVKHTQTIRRLLPTNCLSVFDHFVGLALKRLIWVYSLLKMSFYKIIKISSFNAPGGRSCMEGHHERSYMLKQTCIF